MKLTYLTLLVLITLGFVSCRKDNNDIGIKDYDEQQITNYIKANGLSNMKKATGDTSGIYYEILSQDPNGTPFEYKDTISFVYTIQSLDGLYNVTDTTLNHSFAYAGQLTPSGLQLAMNTLVKKRGTRARLIIPSHLAYGQSGSGTGSNRLRGNQSLMYYVNVINNQDAYDDACIQSYFKTNSINPAEYTKITSGSYKGMYYKIRKAGTGTTLVTDNVSTVVMYYRGKLLNGNIFDPSNYSDTNLASTTTIYFNEQAVTGGQIPELAFRGALLLGQKEGTDMTIVIPSRLAFNRSSQTSSTGVVIIPASSALSYDITIGAVTN